MERFLNSNLNNLINETKALDFTENELKEQTEIKFNNLKETTKHRILNIVNDFEQFSDIEKEVLEGKKIVKWWQDWDP